MSNRIIKVSLSFEFEPDREHEDLFEDMTEEKALLHAKSMAYDDMVNGDIWRMLEVQVTYTCEECGDEASKDDRLCEPCFDQWVNQASRGGR